MMLAQDNIAAVHARKLVAKVGDHVGIIDDLGDYDDARNGRLDWHEIQTRDDCGIDLPVTEVDLCHAIHDSAKACMVCVRGGLLMARIGYQHPVDEDCEKDQLSPHGNMNGRPVAISLSQEDFDGEQAALMECTFERSYEMNDYEASFSARVSAANYGDALPDEDTERFLAIMQNVVDNKGDFVIPEQYYEDCDESDEDDDESEED